VSLAIPVSKHDVGLLIIRGMVGFILFYHGAQKLFGWFGGHGLAGFASYLKDKKVPMPEVNAYVAGGTEFLGGILLMVGLLTRLVCLPAAFTMAVAFAVGHGGKFNVLSGGGEYAFTLCVVLIGLALTGAGRISADARVFK